MVDGDRVRGLDLHLARLVRDCDRVFGRPLDPGRVRGLLRRVASRCDGPAMLRATVFDPAFDLARPAPGPVGPVPPGPTPPGAGEPSVLVTTRPAPARSGRSGLRLRTTRYVRDLPEVKHIGMFGPLHQRRLAQAAGYDDALFVTDAGPAGRIGEGPTWNVALLIEGELVWPDGDCLPGVTRALMQQVLTAAGAGWSTRPVARAELADATAAYVTSAGVGVLPVTSIDDVPLPGDPELLDRLGTGYATLPGTPL